MSEKEPEIKTILVTDCGSTTTKAILFEKTDIRWKMVARGESSTTVEDPVADVTIGVLNSFKELQDISGRTIVQKGANEDTPEPMIMPSMGTYGIDLYLSTSSAGGGLQMIVAGVVGDITAQSAQKAALGAGAIVVDVISFDDGRKAYERINRIRYLRPDIILISGGTENGTTKHPLELVELIMQADPKPRFGNTLKLPVVFAANSEAQKEAKAILDESFSFIPVDNLRPSLDVENLAPARDSIHNLFLHHVMSHAPGYAKLMNWAHKPIIPTPSAVGTMVQAAAKFFDKRILAVDIGGATTDIFSLIENDRTGESIFHRTVSANLGMSYSITNVLEETGIENIQRWMPMTIREKTIIECVINKMIRPTSIPEVYTELLVEQAVCREALRLALRHHKGFTAELKGVKKTTTIADMFKSTKCDNLFGMQQIDMIIGSGGVLSHAPMREQTILMLIDAFEPLGITKLAVDSIFMMPHLGILSEINKRAAVEIFENDCLIMLGTVVAPSWPSKYKKEKNLTKKILVDEMEISPLMIGDFTRILPNKKSVKISILPNPEVDLGNGVGVKIEEEVPMGCCGLILDARGRPFNPESQESIRQVFTRLKIPIPEDEEIHDNDDIMNVDNRFSHYS